MKAHYMNIFLITSLLTFIKFQLINGAQSNSTSDQKNRRILHQPLFPVDSAPAPPPPPPSDEPEEGQPFSNELPAGATFDQPPPLPDIGTAVAIPSAATPPHSNTVKKLAIATSSTLVTVGMLLAMGYFLYKNRGERREESQKLVVSDECRVPPPAFLCVETAEPSTGGIVNVAGGSPYQKLNRSPGKRFDHYRPSPDLQPLPPLKKPPPPPRMSSPPPMSSSDDESHDTRLYTAQGTSSTSNESPNPQHYNVSNKTSQVSQPRPDNLASKPVPHSKRTPPKSRFSSSSPDAKPAVVPSIKQSWPPSPPPPTTSLGPLQYSKPLPFSPNRTKFSASPPPPPPSIEQCRSMSNYEQKASIIPIPPPPPPPPPPSMARKYVAAKTYTPPVFKQARRSQSKSPSPKASPSSNKTRPASKDAENMEGSRPKMKPLHWDKVQSSTDGATVWDHLKSTSFQ